MFYIVLCPIVAVRQEYKIDGFTKLTFDSVQSNALFHIHIYLTLL